MILRVEPDWYEDFDNPSSFSVLLSEIPQDYVFTETDGQYFAVNGPCVRMFAYRRPGEGFGGRVFSVKMEDGSTRDLKGPWSSGASASNSHHPDYACVDCSITDQEDVMKKGYTFSAGHILIEPLVDWWLQNQQTLNWGIYFMANGTVQPSKGRFVKNGGSYIARLLPSKLAADQFAQYAPNHKKYFMTKLTEFWKAQKPRYDELSSEQRIVVDA